jgi:Ribonuclease G/E
VTSLETWTDASVGETRRALVRDGKPIALQLWRWSERGRRALWGEVYEARVRSVDARRRGAFLDLGLEEAGFVRLDAAGRVRLGDKTASLAEGQAVRVAVRREGARRKGPVLAVEAILPAIDRPARVGSHESSLEPADARRATPELRERLDAAFEAALTRQVPLVGGGALIVEPTAALVAIDVDAGERAGAADAERFALALNVEAAGEAMRQLRLRNLGGIVAIDFVSMRGREGREATLAALRAAAKDDPWGVQIALMSRFGVVELSRGQLQRPLAEALCDEEGALSAESAALAALRGVEREAHGARGRLVVLRVSADIGAWLDTAVIDWRTALAARIGPRWEVRTEPALRARAWSAEPE